jgi:hypothetical protein
MTQAYKNKFRVLYTLMCCVFFGIQAKAQPVTVDIMQNPNKYTIMYVSDLVQDPGTAPVIFHMRVSPELGTEPEVHFEVEFIADVEDLGLSNSRIFYLKTEPFPLTGTINLTNRLLASRTNILQTENGNQITINSESLQFLSGAEREELINSLLNAPTVPPGLYTFRYAIYTDNEIIEEDIIPIRFEQIPSLRLLAPADNSIIQTNYPVFQWESTGADRGCDYGIRISEFLPQRHGSLEEALNDDSVYPFPDDGNFVRVNRTALQYPLSEAKQLETGRQYVWQVRKFCTSTRGEVTYESEIFKLTVGGDEIDPVRIALRNILGDERYDQLFGAGGTLAGYSADQGNIMIDGEVISLSQLMNIATQFSTGGNELISNEVVE